MDLTTPAASVLPAVRARVLIALAGAEDGLTGRRVAALACTSVSTTARVLDGLTAGGVIHRTQVGSACVYKLNRDHLAADAVLALATMRTRLIEQLAARLRGFEHRPATAVLFGSAARGDGDEDGDIDLLLVRPADVDDDDPQWRHDVDQLCSALLNWTGNSPDVLEYDQDELDQMLAENRPLARGLARDGIHIYGRPLKPIRLASPRRKATG